MHITLETDYALCIMDCLAKEKCRMGAQSISNQTGVTLRFSLKILRKLVKSGMVCSFKGAQGGYELARPLNEISINDILNAIEGPYMFSRCLVHDGLCVAHKGRECCSYSGLFKNISATVEQMLKEATLDQYITEE